MKVITLRKAVYVVEKKPHTNRDEKDNQYKTFLERTSFRH